MVTALDGREERMRAVRAGANDFIAKPVDRTELEVRIASQLKLKEARETLSRHHIELEDAVAARTADLRAAVAELAEAQRRTLAAHLDTIRRLVLAAEFKDGQTAQHILRIRHYTAVLARALEMPRSEVAALGHAATLHDVGKFGIPDAILAKGGVLSREERRIMEQHPLIGGRILADSPSELIQEGRKIALSHHEKWDGSGYPHGTREEQIPLGGRICAIADVFDALTTDRPYRTALSPATALAMMQEERGTRFDPRLLDLFLTHRGEVLAVWRGFQAGGDHESFEPLAENGVLR
jgi:putative two-component system response regulator